MSREHGLKSMQSRTNRDLRRSDNGLHLASRKSEWLAMITRFMIDLTVYFYLNQAMSILSLPSRAVHIRFTKSQRLFCGKLQMPIRQLPGIHFPLSCVPKHLKRFFFLVTDASPDRGQCWSRHFDGLSWIMFSSLECLN